MKKNLLRTAALAFAFGVTSPAAFASLVTSPVGPIGPTFCNLRAMWDNPTENDSLPQLFTRDLWYGSSAAADCFGPLPGSDDDLRVNAIGWGTGFLMVARDIVRGSGDDVKNTVFGLEWDLDADQGSFGDWNLRGQDRNGTSPNNLGDRFDFIGVIRAGNAWGAYFFPARVFSGEEDGEFTVRLTNPNNHVLKLTHLSWYARPAVPENHIPEPTPLALAGVGLLALGLTRRKWD